MGSVWFGVGVAVGFRCGVLLLVLLSCSFGICGLESICSLGLVRKFGVVSVGLLLI